MAASTVLYVEDEEYDVFFMQRAFTRVAKEHVLEVATDGQKAIDYLSDSSHPKPDLILLDLNLPLISGFEVLNWIRCQEAFGGLPVVVFSSSARREDQAKAHELGANEYIQKPGSAMDFVEVAKSLNARWFQKTGSA